ncbi:MAG: cytochrome, partial [Pseudarthrobacter sp.]|nr:cytochrome [Pseudarthrobacter sp.]
TPMILRQTTREVHWPDGDMPAGCGVLVYAPYFHRDDEHVPQAHSFNPERWLGRDDNEDWPLVPFSEGPVVCPGRQLVLMLTSAMLAALLGETTFKLSSPHTLGPGRRLPGELNNFSLSFTVAGSQPQPSRESSA